MPTQGRSRGANTPSAEILWYRPDVDAWEVGTLVWYEFPKPRMHLALVDPHTGEVRTIVDRPWSEKTDGFP